jgi:hypothetical protein
VDIPDEGVYYVLIDLHGYKHLLKKEYYLHYHFEIGGTIQCRIDKINCSGKIYLEPEHPLYKEGKAYDFEVVEQKEITNLLGESQKILIIKDLFENLLTVSADEAQIENNCVSCVVDQIKKGQLFVTPINATKAIKGLKEGDWFHAKIAKHFTDEDHNSFFLLKDKNNHSFYLPTKYYENYHLQIGDQIYCKVVKIRSQWDYVIEPQSPHYSEGAVYDFVVKGKKIEHNYMDEKVYLFIVQDIFEIETNVEVSHKTYVLTPIGDTIRCKVDRIKKSKLLLSIDNPIN